MFRELVWGLRVYIWVVVKIRVRYPKQYLCTIIRDPKRDHSFDNHPYNNEGSRRALRKNC